MPNLQKIADDPALLKESVDRMMQRAPVPPRCACTQLERAISDRNAAEVAFSEAFRLVCSRSPNWSSSFDYSEALDELREQVRYLLDAEAHAAGEDPADDQRAREGSHAAWAASIIFGFAFHALRGDMLATGILLIFALWNLIQAARWAARANAAEVANG